MVDRGPRLVNPIAVHNISPSLLLLNRHETPVRWPAQPSEEECVGHNKKTKIRTTQLLFAPFTGFR